MPSIKDLQVKLPWTTHYHRDFRSSSMTHKDFGHALLHIHKAAGKLAAIIDNAEHGGSEFKPEEVDPYIADLVICALRMANTCPGRVIDLEAAVIDRIEKKNQMKITAEKFPIPDKNYMCLKHGSQYKDTCGYCFFEKQNENPKSRT